ncbi:MAG TPA: MFS transporter [Polyangia bacterium]|jgi:predicted MFS family arabinose efflux permease
MAGPAPAPGTDDPASFRRIAVVIAVGIFITGLGWPGLIGRLPFGLLLKNELHFAPEKVAAFWAVGTIAWYLKPLFGLVCDAWPIFGTRRHGYLLLGSLLASGAWAAFAILPRTFGALMTTMTALNIGLVVVSVSVGGMLVEEGQRQGATGRLSAMRTALEGVMSLVAGPLGGVLAVVSFGVTAFSGAFTVAVMLPVTLLLHREPRRARADGAVWSTALGELRHIVRSRPMWMTSLLLFLVYLAPGLQTPLLYYQQDVLKLDARFMGLLQFAGGAGVLVGAAIYTWVCRRLPLRWTLVGGIVLNAACALLYLAYHSATAALLIETAVGLMGAIATLPLYDLAARATPKGSESFGFALMMSVRNISLFAISDPLGSMLYGRYHLGFDKLVLANAGSTLAVLLLVPLLPAALLSTREGKTV